MKICCPTCRTVIEDVPADYPSRPFCSKRCKLADLSNWMNERYRISSSGSVDDANQDPTLN